MSKATKITGSAMGYFCLGMATAVVLLGVAKFVSLFSVPSLQKLREKATADIPKLGDDNNITVWGFQLAGEHPSYDQGIVDGSVFVARVEAYLRLIGQDYIKAKTVRLRENPRHTLPIANVYGTMVDDSSRILDVINKHFNIDPNENLTPAQVALGHLVQRLLTDSLYFVGLYLTFATEHGREVIKSEFEHDIPAFVFPVVMPTIFRNQMDRLQGQGIAKWPIEQIYDKGKEDLIALATILGSNRYILGTDQPTVYDTDMYAVVSSFFYSEPCKDLAWVKEVKKVHPLLPYYIYHMRAMLFPELDKPQEAKTN